MMNLPCNMLLRRLSNNRNFFKFNFLTPITHIERPQNLKCVLRKQLSTSQPVYSYFSFEGSKKNQNYNEGSTDQKHVQTILDFGKDNFQHRYAEEHVQEICQMFLNGGVSRSDLVHAFCRQKNKSEKNASDPHVFTMNLKVLQSLLNVFANHGVPPEGIIRCIIYCGSDIKAMTPERLDALLSNLAAENYLQVSLIFYLSICPALLYMEKDTVDKLEYLASMFPPKELKHLLNNAPNVLSDSWSTTQEKIFYINKEMGLDQPHMAYNHILSFSLQHIKDRHEAMVRSGSYKKPKLFRDRLSHLMNPRIDFIMESSDEQFCKRILKIPLEDYQAFLTLVHREEEYNYQGLAADDYDSDEEDLIEAQKRRESYGQPAEREQKKPFQIWLARDR